MKPLLLAAVSLTLMTMAAPSQAAGTHSERRGGVALDPRTMASITHGPDMITRAGYSQKRARAELDSNHPALADTVTAKRWQQIKNR
jgi:hypothetical protein